MIKFCHIPIKYCFSATEKRYLADQHKNCIPKREMLADFPCRQQWRAPLLQAITFFRYRICIDSGIIYPEHLFPFLSRVQVVKLLDQGEVFVINHIVAYVVIAICGQV